MPTAPLSSASSSGQHTTACWPPTPPPPAVPTHDPLTQRIGRCGVHHSALVCQPGRRAALRASSLVKGPCCYGLWVLMRGAALPAQAHSLSAALESGAAQRASAAAFSAAQQAARQAEAAADDAAAIARSAAPVGIAPGRAHASAAVAAGRWSPMHGLPTAAAAPAQAPLGEAHAHAAASHMQVHQPPGQGTSSAAVQHGSGFLRPVRQAPPAAYQERQAGPSAALLSLLQTHALSTPAQPRAPAGPLVPQVFAASQPSTATCSVPSPVQATAGAQPLAPKHDTSTASACQQVQMRGTAQGHVMPSTMQGVWTSSVEQNPLAADATYKQFRGMSRHAHGPATGQASGVQHGRKAADASHSQQPRHNALMPAAAEVLAAGSTGQVGAGIGAGHIAVPIRPLARRVVPESSQLMTTAEPAAVLPAAAPVLESPSKLAGAVPGSTYQISVYAGAFAAGNVPSSGSHADAGET